MKRVLCLGVLGLFSLCLSSCQTVVPGNPLSLEDAIVDAMTSIKEAHARTVEDGKGIVGVDTDTVTVEFFVKEAAGEQGGLTLANPATPAGIGGSFLRTRGGEMHNKVTIVFSRDATGKPIGDANPSGPFKKGNGLGTGFSPQ